MSSKEPAEANVSLYAPVKKILLTGAGGFLGRNLLPLLLRDGMCVTAVSSRSYDELCKLAALEEPDDSLRVVSVDDRLGISKALVEADCLINAGFPRNNNGQQIAKALDFSNWLFREAATRGAGSAINLSSQSVYDQHRIDPATEETPVCPQSSYAVAKYAVELMLNSLCTSIPHTNIRLASLVGPGFDERVVNKMVHYAVRDGEIRVKDSNSRFGYLDIRDASNALCALIKTNPHNWAEIYNLGTEETYSLIDIASKIQIVCGRLGVDVKILNSYEDGLRTNSALCSRGFEKLTGWKSSTPIMESVRSIALSVFDETEIRDLLNAE